MGLSILVLVFGGGRVRGSKRGPKIICRFFRDVIRGGPMQKTKNSDVIVTYNVRITDGVIFVCWTSC